MEHFLIIFVTNVINCLLSYVSYVCLTTLETVLSPAGNSYVTQDTVISPTENSYGTQDTVISPSLAIVRHIINPCSSSYENIDMQSKQRSGILNQINRLCFYLKTLHDIYHMGDYTRIFAIGDRIESPGELCHSRLWHRVT